VTYDLDRYGVSNAGLQIDKIEFIVCNSIITTIQHSARKSRPRTIIFDGKLYLY
jgi:hypothetical protein